MDTPNLGKRFQESTRGRIVHLLRRGQRTVEELANALQLTPNAVRGHLASLERDRLVQQEGIRRGAGAGKPAVLYGLNPETNVLLSRAYPAVLSTLVDTIVRELPIDASVELMRQTGERLAEQFGGRASGDYEERVRAAAAVLEALGGDVDVVTNDNGMRILGSGCPLSAVVCNRPEFCQAVATMISEVAGAEAHVCCTHGAAPRCCFRIDSAA